MLGSIRDRATGWIAGVIVGALIISFAFWGVSFYFGGGGEANVARVNDTEIDMQTYQRAFFNLRRQMQQMFGDELSLEEEELIRQQTLKRLIDSEIINQIVKNNNLRVTNEQVAATITNLEMFQDEQGFDRYKYEQAIASLGMQPAAFEQQLRMDLLSEQLQSGLAETMFVTNDELKDVMRMKNQKRDITYAILGIDNYIDEDEVSDSELQSYYEENKQRYAEPEKVRIAYLDLDVAKIAETIEFTEDDLRAYYQNNKDAYDVAEQRTVTRLLVKLDEEPSEEEIAKARTVIEKAAAMAQEGKTFEEIVETFSEEELGGLEFSENAFLTRGILDEEVDEFVFNNIEGSVSDIIQTETAFVIAQVGEIRGGPKNKFENVAEQVENDYKRDEAELMYFEMADKLTTLAYEHPDTLVIAAEEIDMPIQESDFFSRNNDNDDITANDRIIAASFEQELIDSGQNSDAIDLGDNHVAVIRVLEYKPSSIKPLEEVREQVMADVKRDRAAEKLQQVGQNIISQLEAGIAPGQVETKIKLNWNNADGVTRDATNVTRSVLRTAFEMEQPQDEPVIKGYSLGSGDYAIVMLKDVEDGSVDDIKETTATATRNELKRIRGAAEWLEFLKNAREDADVKVFEENI